MGHLHLTICLLFPYRLQNFMDRPDLACWPDVLDLTFHPYPRPIVHGGTNVLYQLQYVT